MLCNKELYVKGITKNKQKKSLLLAEPPLFWCLSIFSIPEQFPNRQYNDLLWPFDFWCRFQDCYTHIYHSDEVWHAWLRTTKAKRCLGLKLGVIFTVAQGRDRGRLMLADRWCLKILSSSVTRLDFFRVMNDDEYVQNLKANSGSCYRSSKIKDSQV